MRVTGNNTSGSKDLSILIHRGGLSFFDRQNGKTEHYETSGGGVISSHEACAAAEGYYSMHPTHKSVMAVVADRCGTVVPERLFDEESKRDYMECAGIEVADGQDVISICRHGMVFLAAIDKALRERLETIYGDTAIVPTSLLSVACARRQATHGTVVTADVAGGAMTLALHHGKRLLFVDTLPVSSHEDMVFYIERLLRDNGLDTPTVVCAGMAATATAEVLGRYYRVAVLRPEDYFTI